MGAESGQVTCGRAPRDWGANYPGIRILFDAGEEVEPAQFLLAVGRDVAQAEGFFLRWEERSAVVCGRRRSSRPEQHG